MTRKDLEKFDPTKLAKGASKSFEVRNPTTGYGEHHYFYRSKSGELFTCVAHRLDTCKTLRTEWLAAPERTQWREKDVVNVEETVDNN